jgi:natural product biosynthesis luciferase-like monooxygenase protein
MMSISNQSKTLVELLRQRAAQQPNRIAYTFLAEGDRKETSLTYADLDRRARSIASLLQSSSVVGERVLLLYPHGPDYIAAFFGCLYAGAVAVPVYPPRKNKSVARIESIVEDAKPVVALTTAEIASRIRLSLDSMSALNSVRWAATGGENDGLQEEWREPSITDDTLAFLQYTSGSTGTPKGVMLSHRNLLHNSALLHRSFEYTPDSVCVSWLPVYHDMGLIGGILQPLYGGFRCALLSPVSFLQRPSRWLEAISQYKATISGGPDFGYELCVRKIDPLQISDLDLSSWKTAFNGAEPIRVETLDRFTKAFEAYGFRKESFYACYGLAEATLLVSGSQNTEPPVIKSFQTEGLRENRCVEIPSEGVEAQRLVGCGRNLQDIQVRIVNPDTRMMRPPNEVGEIWVSGDSVAHGYWNREAETSETFEAFTSDSGQGPFLRTGDLGFLQGGELFITGRLKDLIIIRGLNHYPQDIEHTVERCHSSLRPGSGAAFSITMSEEERLVVVQEASRSKSDYDGIIWQIRQSVAREHELQPFAVVLIRPGSLPKTSSGKVQRKFCKKAFLEGALENVADWRESGNVGTESVFAASTSNDFEKAAQIQSWLISQIAARTGVSPLEITIDQPLDRFAMDSLAAVELGHSIENQLGVAPPMASFLNNLSIRELVNQALELKSRRPSTEERAGAPLPQNNNVSRLSHGQKALWFLHQLSPETASYHIAAAARIREQLDVEALRRSFEHLIERHAGLRTTFSVHNGEPLQRLNERMDLSFHQEDASTYSSYILDERLTAYAHAAFDLETGPLLRIVVFKFSLQEHLILLVMHHIVSDFWSLAVLLDELKDLYSGELKGSRVTLNPLSLNYIDYIHRRSEKLAGEEGERLWSYWKNQLHGKLPALALPTDRSRPAVQTYRGAAQPFKIQSRISEGLKQTAQKRRATLFMTLLAGFQSFLYRYTGQDDLLIGSLTSGRTSAELSGIIGYFVNPLVIRVEFTSQLSFTALLERSRQKTLEAFEHQDYPFPLLVERLQPDRDAARSPVFQVMFSFQKAPLLEDEGLTALAIGETDAQIRLGELCLEPIRLEQKTAQFDLTLAMAEVGGRLSASLQYNSDLFDSSTINSIIERFEIFLNGVVAEPDRPISTLPWLSDAERRSLLIEWNNIADDFPADACIHQEVEEKARTGPDRIAAVFGNEQLSRRELNRRANQLAQFLQSAGVGPQTLVGVFAERSLNLLVGLMAILKAGGAYVPLDPYYPKDRLEFVIADAGIGMIVTERRLINRLEQTNARLVCLDSNDFDAFPESSPASTAAAENLAYVIYTSGSTGKPKGVMVSHKNVINFFCGMDQRIGSHEEDVLLAVTSISFDISVLELFYTLSRGTKVILQHDQQLGGEARRMARPPANKPVNFSLFYFASSDALNKEDRYRLLIDGARFADRNGFEAVWTPERHFHAFGGLFPNPSVMSAALAAMTEKVKIRAGSVVLPLHNPIRIAEEWSLVDNLSGGRAGVAFASGWHSDDFVFSPENYNERKEITFEGIKIIQQLWRGEPIKTRGGGGNEIEVKIFPTPIQPELPVWITAAGNSDTFIKAGSLGANVLTHLLGQSIDDVAEKIRLYRQALAEHGRDPQSGRVTLMIHAFLDRDSGLVREKVRIPFTNYLRSSIGLISNLIVSLGLPLDLKAMSAADIDALLSFAFERYFETGALFGSPQTCLPMVEHLKEIGVDEIACLIDFGVEIESVLASLQFLDQLKALSNQRIAAQTEEIDYSLSSQATLHKPTIMQCTPSMMKMLAADSEAMSSLRSLRTLLLGGEALPPALISQVKGAVSATIVNMYGPTETTIWSSADEIEHSNGCVPIGRPIRNTQIYILDKNQQPLPAGSPGGIHIGGAGLAVGYFGHSDMTAQRFTPNPFSETGGERLYHTGDLARFLDAERMEFLGRIDQQVKIRGFRIELEEIETLLNEHRYVREAVVIVREDFPGDKRLIAYIVLEPGDSQVVADIEESLKRKLPDYMVPSSFVVLERFPLTANGKVDRGGLPALSGARKELKSEYIQPQGELEHMIAGVWRGALQVEKVGRDDNFFDLGGHSLLLAQVHGELSKSLNKKLPLIKMLQYPTIGSLARFLSQEEIDTLSIKQSQDRAGKFREGLERQRRSSILSRSRA